MDAGEKLTKPSGGTLAGATAVAFIIVLVVMTVVAGIVGGLATLVNYYMSSMRIEAAGFFGALIGGWVGVISSRASCDAILKHYSQRAVFIFVITVVAIGMWVEFFIAPLSWERLAPVAQLFVITVASYVYFWKGEPVDF